MRGAGKPVHLPHKMAEHMPGGRQRLHGAGCDAERRQGLLKCSDCPLFEPLAPLGAGYEGWGLCLSRGVDGAATERCCSGACAAFIAEVDADV